MMTWAARIIMTGVVLGAALPAVIGAKMPDAELKALTNTSPSKTIRRLAAGQLQLIVCHGTSLTYGGAWVEQIERELQQRFPCNVLMINSGVGGSSSPGGVGSLQRRVLRANPDCVFLEYGINDAYEGYKIPVAMCRSNLVCMIDRILTNNPECEIILMTMNPVTGKAAEVRPHLEDYYQVYRDVARERGLMLVDNYPNWLTVMKTDRTIFNRFIPDGLHPGALGCSVVITPAIMAALGLGPGFEEAWKAYQAKTVLFKAGLPKDLAVAPRKDATNLPALAVVSADRGITLDGKLNEEVWKRPWSAGFVIADGQPAAVATAVQGAYDATNLYLAFICADPDPTKLKSTARQETEIYSNSDDALVIFLQPDENQPLYYQLAFNPKGLHFDQKIENNERDYGFAPKWESAAAVSGAGWTAEVVLPLSSFNLEGRPLSAARVNFHRVIRDSLADSSSWSFTAKDWHQPGRFGRLQVNK